MEIATTSWFGARPTTGASSKPHTNVTHRFSLNSLVSGRNPKQSVSANMGSGNGEGEDSTMMEGIEEDVDDTTANYDYLLDHPICLR